MPKKCLYLDPERGYDLASSVYDKKEKYLNSFEQSKVLRLFGNVSGKKILDVGAGTGRLSLPLAAARAEVIALDISRNMLKVLARRAKRRKINVASPLETPALATDESRALAFGSHGMITTVIGNAEDLPFADSYFDFVVAAFLIVHLKNPRRFFDQAYRVLKDGGSLLVTNINQKDPPEIVTPAGSVVIKSYYHRPDATREMLEELAFTVESEEIVRGNSRWINQILFCKK